MTRMCFVVTLRSLLVASLVGVVPVAGLTAQEHATVRRAKAAYDGLEFSRAVAIARQALNERLSSSDRVLTYEILAFSFGALDSARQAVEAFRELIFLDPDREPDVERVSPRITALYASALGQVLVVRGVGVDSTSFVAGRGGVPIRYEVSRPARAVTRVIGPGYGVVIDSQLVAGMGGVRWQALTPEGEPVPAGRYQVVVTAIEGRNEYAAQVEVAVRHGTVDTLPHLTALPGYTELPETERPPRNWQPLGIAVLYAGLSAGAAVALENTDLGDNYRRGVVGVSFAALVTGVVMSVRRPDPQPVQANILYNRLLREQLAQRNREIAQQNAERRREVRLTITPVAAAGGGEGER